MGKILVGGSQNDPRVGTRSIVTRLNANGTTDTTYGTSGIAAIETGVGNSSQVETMTLDGDGKLAISGTDPSTTGAYIARLNSDGTPDGTFGTRGVVHPSMGGAGIAVTASNQPIVAGPNGRSFSVMRVTAVDTRPADGY